MKAFIGTSGWSYSSFKKVFFPENLKSRDYLKFYSQHFNTVEINATFYRLPRKSTFEKWYEETPEGFVFSVKASKIITHIKRIKNVKNELITLLERTIHLKEKLGPFLFQLPPSLKFDESLIKDFFELLNLEEIRDFFRNSFKGKPYWVIEVRNKTFQDERFFELCKNYGICLCFSDCAGRYPSWIEVKTTDFLYIRMHGSKKLYVSNYEEEELMSLYNKIVSFKPEEVFVYFDNTALGYAVTNALRLKEFFEKAK